MLKKLIKVLLSIIVGLIFIATALFAIPALSMLVVIEYLGKKEIIYN